MKKEYSKGDLTVVWRPDMCIHSAKCVHGLGKVFDPNRKPWIDLDQATSEEIIDQVGKCPSGALAIKESETALDQPMVSVQLMEGGPLFSKVPAKSLTNPAKSMKRKMQLSADAPNLPTSPTVMAAIGSSRTREQ